MSIKRRDLIEHFEAGGYRLLREGGKHTIYVRGLVKIAIKRHRVMDRITANRLCKQAGLAQIY